MVTGVLPDRLSSLLRQAVHPKWGLIRSLVEMPIPSGFPPVHMLYAEFTDYRRIRGVGWSGAPVVPKGASCETSLHAALWATIGESLERYGGSIYDEEELPLCTAGELGDTARLADDLILFSDASYGLDGMPYRPYDSNRPRRWAEGWNRLTGEAIHLPAQVVLFDYVEADSWERLLPPCSSGLGSGTTLEQAALAALCEVVERDAFMVHWLLRRRPTRLPKSQIEAALRDPALAPLLDSPALNLHVMQLDTDIGIPVILAAIKSASRNIVAFGASCKLSPMQAVRKAVLEALHCWFGAYDHRVKKLPDMTKDRIVGFLDHAAYYYNEDHFSNVAFLLDGETRELEWDGDCEAAAGKPAGEQLDAVARKLASLGYVSCLFDLSPVDVRELGFRVVRAIIPGLHPLYSGPWIVDQDTRLRRVGKFLGLNPDTPLNREPHPFP
ncbi:hypothetical protein TSH100_15300 [Azospirillum sp. TSH100]|uniref:YcaO-like family protein n=1 Tax=Azospirillum sp. TSH100 TaxID=652764 RepID=UPI000D6063D4|nr:YcaO-like family protein [Azospirillum sp. TSH100]PWC85514.1 hypothetical protein TSH100_15300 [Azospirillum sp. TSH100]